LKNNGEPGELARAISELAAAERWRLEELHTEEGRLDEVFRDITRPETKQEEPA
jgi:ABC-2 type transport system ATP-binding protein